jgi:hypothetical protein
MQPKFFVASVLVDTLFLILADASRSQYRLDEAVFDGRDDTFLSLTAVTSDEHDTKARIECWQFKQPFIKYPTVGKALHLADLSNVTYVVLPPYSKEGLHHPPAPMLFVLVTGAAHVTIPDSSDELWITEQGDQVVIANDIHGIGHDTEYPLNRDTVALQLPFKDAKVPEYRMLHMGSCMK